MTTKTSGAELKLFYSDPQFWPNDDGNTWHEDENVTVNGEEWLGEYTDVPDDAKIIIDGGIVFSSKFASESEPSFETYFKRWKKQQNTAFIVVEFPKEKQEAVIAAIKAAGGKVAS